MADSLLFNPHTYDPAHFDPETRRLLRATVDWFEERGKRRLIEDYRTRAWLGTSSPSPPRKDCSRRS